MVQRKSIYGALVAGLLALCLLGAGCTSQPAEQQNVTATPTPEATTAAPETNATATPAPAEEYVFNETNYNETVTLPVGSEITIRLAENPTTGYEWNVTSYEGLQLVNETHDAPQTELVGAGGVHVWEYIAAEEGAGEFSAVYMRPWENVTGNETAFSMAFTIE
ncbi:MULTISPECIES: protease inhibitor I42 family protein [unclassified Methanoculleus]|uniref:protease inhibitor I42 family protein n=1 Tax=unclassified Methanoculleus TaxID=2619537 RepID=UPI0025EC873A|nr:MULTISPECIES: protease inhibitor I42 family protein [unclassified Methanoculleus]MCK9318022.1 protease inhibitor I42 family protein [Methanoculleus sp.]MDD2253246.1 protease inhibitor I42 family protein [Methanoculleus sp.]MDD2787141.1 protease inhibitor I42 family protein [Methanoculleus sp.]MDD3215516.1 protease inhibitor I42 family protein [Methanoculleus sp.]MDD4313210.1 protease inhibitor I42 family protein [Methanoculleus sp.]